MMKIDEHFQNLIRKELVIRNVDRYKSWF
jgi:hypothetical protein